MPGRMIPGKRGKGCRAGARMRLLPATGRRTMRRLAPALLLLMASCGQGDRGPNQSFGDRGPPRTSDSPVPAPTIVIAATGPGGCSASWDGQAVTPAQITERSVALLDRAFAAIGGRQNITLDNLPVPNVEAPAESSVACVDPILFAFQRAGVITVTLKPVGGQAPVLMDFPLETNSPPPPIPTVLGIGAGGQVTWNSDPLDAAGLAAQLTRIGGSSGPADAMEEGPPPGYPELRAQPEASFGQLYALLQTTQRYHLRPGVYLPSAGAGPSPVALPAPPPGAPPPPR
jgi:hypothetical protein